jgi:hypothetical protein
MKKVILALALSGLLLSCSDRNKTVKVKSGALISVFDPGRVDLPRGTKVCALGYTQSGGIRWTMCTDGEFLDTTYVIKHNIKGISKNVAIIHKTGYVQ